MREVIEGQLWRNQHGQARVLAVRGGHAMLKRRRGNPMVLPTKRMLDPTGGWEYAGFYPGTPADPEAQEHTLRVEIIDVLDGVGIIYVRCLDRAPDPDLFGCTAQLAVDPPEDADHG